VVLISGEPGVGKTRLLRAFQLALAQGERRRVQWHCSPHYQATANYPAIEQLSYTVGSASRGTAGTLAALSRTVESLELDPERFVPSLARLLSVPLDDCYEAPAWSSDELKRQLTLVQVELLLAAARQSPVLFIVEDLHWADPTTLEVLTEMIAAVRNSRVLIVLTARPEFNSPWSELSHVVTLRLPGLQRSDTLELARNIADDQDLPDSLFEEIVERTDGIPLFIEEVTRSITESLVSPGAIPATLHDSLMARLDSLEEGKAVAQVGAVLGRDFGHDVLQAAWPGNANALDLGLSELVASGLLYHRGLNTPVSYQFKHALVRDTAYESLLRDRRRELHARVAAYLQESRTDVAAELVAQHWFAARDFERAAPLFRKAGDDAVSKAAFQEAIVHFRQGREVALELPDGPVSVKLQVEIGLSLAACLRTTEQAEEAFKVLEASQTSAERYGLNAQLSRIHHMRGNLHFPRGEGQACLEEHRQALEYARAAGASREEAIALGELGDAHYVLGLLRTSSEYIAKCIGLARQEGFADVESGHLANHATNNLYFLEIDTALDTATRAVDLASELGNPRAEVVAQMVRAFIFWEKDELELAEDAANEALELSRSLGAGRSWR
jgi:predicted ATPase